MPSSIRPATDEDRGLARTFAETISDDRLRDLAHLAEDTYDLRVVFKPGNTRELLILMPSGRVLVRDLSEPSWELDKLQTPLGEDRTPNGEIADALTYSGVIRESYLEEQARHQ